jgi:hypothetical protein
MREKSQNLRFFMLRSAKYKKKNQQLTKKVIQNLRIQKIQKIHKHKSLNNLKKHSEKFAFFEKIYIIREISRIFYCQNNEYV